jgi:hypothetical protein
MQPILAESVPHHRRALALAAALAITAALAAVAVATPAPHHAQRWLHVQRLPHNGQCIWVRTAPTGAR